MAIKQEPEEAKPEEVKRTEVPNSSARPNDLPIVTAEHPLPNSTMASRRAAGGKRVGSAENKAIKSDESKGK